MLLDSKYFWLIAVFSSYMFLAGKPVGAGGEESAPDRAAALPPPIK
jgi:hypothetical protein